MTVTADDDDVSSEELLAQESIRPKVNAKIVGKKRNFNFFIGPQYGRWAHKKQLKVREYQTLCYRHNIHDDLCTLYTFHFKVKW